MAEDIYDVFDETAIEQLLAAIANAEKSSSGEVRIHIDNHAKEDLMDRAAFLFEELEMHKTKDRNGVLFYLALLDRKFAILGDVGINTKVPPNFWDSIRDEMQGHFKQGAFVKGLCEGVERAGEELKRFFPYQKDDVNELPDEISFGDQ
ncbi:TPM domain-containing protein [Sanyastnella coralliicola]|uniref:TPM domain-containing protein n=1 Tax=Sanyastnella coralliicola TaxID=3069118 RepID=UPI0027BA0863|nr:TPM domain-containing protein [Longitalea sp. SCSIO 12813]